MKSVLVVGGAGKTGALICENLAGLGMKPIAFDDLSTGVGDRVKFGPLVKVDAKQTPRVLRSLKEHGSQVILHAALAKTAANPIDLFDQNLTTTMSLLKALQDLGAHGTQLILVNPPDATQEMLTRILEDCSKAYGMQVAVIKEADRSKLTAKIAEALKSST